jgi:hypothetical protein
LLGPLVASVDAVAAWLASAVSLRIYWAASFTAAAITAWPFSAVVAVATTAWPFATVATCSVAATVADTCS